MGVIKFRDTAGAFQAAKDGVMVLFIAHAAQYLVRRDHEELARIVGVIANSWAKKQVISVAVSGTTILDATEE